MNAFLGFKSINNVEQTPPKLVENVKISNTSAVNETNYNSKSFIINLTSDTNKFSVLNNVVHKWQVNGKNINDYYKNFKPIKGMMVFSAQNDLDGNKYPLITVKNKNKWKDKNLPYYMTLSNGKIKVKKDTELKEGDKIFMTRKKVFSMDDLDIKNGKIKTKDDSNIGALIPVGKSGKGRGITIGLTDKGRNRKSIDINEATQYGKSRGGSYIIFSEDLQEQYMV